MQAYLIAHGTPSAPGLYGKIALMSNIAKTVTDTMSDSKWLR